MSHQCVERCGQHAKSVDIHAIEIEEAKECSYFLQGRGSFPVLNTLDFDQIHGNGIFLDVDAEVLHFGLFKLAPLRFKVKIVCCKDAQHIVYYTVCSAGSFGVWIRMSSI